MKKCLVAFLLLSANAVVVVACGGGGGGGREGSPPALSVPPVTESPSSSIFSMSDAGVTTAPIAQEDEGPTFPPGDDATTIDPAALSGKDPVFITVDLRLVRAHPKLKDLDAPIMALAGQRASSAGVNVLRDIDQVVILGDSLTRTQNDVMTLTFASASTNDAQVNRFTRALASGYAKGGPFDAGASPPVYATLAMMDGNERALLRPRSKLLVVAPVARAGELGSAYAKSGAPRQQATNTEAVVMSLKDPSKLLSIPRMTIPASVTALRLSILPHTPQGDVEVLMDATCTDPKAAKSFADDFNAAVTEARKSIVVKIMSGDALKDAKLVADPKSGHAKMQMTLSDDQVQRLVGLVGAFVGTSP